MQVNSISQANVNNNTRPSFGAKIGPGLKYLVKDDPRYDGFMKMFANWGDSNTVVDIYKAQIHGKSKYMLRLSNKVLDNTTVPFQRSQSEFMKKNLINRFFGLTPASIELAEYSLFKEVKDFARGAGKPYLERLSNIVRIHKLQGIVFDPKTAKTFNEI